MNGLRIQIPLWSCLEASIIGQTEFYAGFRSESDSNYYGLLEGGCTAWSYCTVIFNSQHSLTLALQYTSIFICIDLIFCIHVHIINTDRIAAAISSSSDRSRNEHIIRADWDWSNFCTVIPVLNMINVYRYTNNTVLSSLAPSRWPSTRRTYRTVRIMRLSILHQQQWNTTMRKDMNY